MFIVDFRENIVELDHLFICVAGKAETADLLSDFGLEEGSANTHPGQGTANRRFFVDNCCIELLYLTDADEAQSELTAPTRLYERLSVHSEPGWSNAVSPFGVCFRPTEGESTPPFSHWRYQPGYLPETLGIFVGHAPLTEPMWFYLPFGARPDGAAPASRQPLQHRCGLREVTSVRVTAIDTGTYSDAVIEANKLPGFDFQYGTGHLLCIGFDGETQGCEHHFTPALPLMFRW